jgi:hypothetical protein
LYLEWCATSEIPIVVTASGLFKMECFVVLFCHQLIEQPTGSRAEEKSVTPTVEAQVPSAQKIQFFSANDAPRLTETDILTIVSPPELKPLIRQAISNGLAYGEEVRVLFNVPGFSLVHAWFKKSYPLPVHTHDADCLYFIVSGELRLGNRALGKGDGFFVPANVPYSYSVVGDNGVEVLEFRHATSFDFCGRSGEAFWLKAIETCRTHNEVWKQARSPLVRNRVLEADRSRIWMAAADQFWSALDTGSIAEALECCSPEFTWWRSSDHKPLDRAAFEAEARRFSESNERETSRVRRSLLPDGLLQQHVVIVRPKNSNERTAWAACARLSFEETKLKGIEEYLDRAGSFDPDM